MSGNRPEELADNSLEDIVGGSGKKNLDGKPGRGKKPTGFSVSNETGDGVDLLPGSQPGQTSGSNDS